MRKLVTIQKIAEVGPIPGADSIEKVRVNEWWCVAKKGEFKVGDFCVYFEVDSLLPVREPFLFLQKGSTMKRMLVDGVEKQGIRLKTIKLRGQLSQGLVMPVSILPAGFTFTAEEGQEVTQAFDVIKYEPPIPASLAGKVKGFFPGFIPKTDEERVQNMGPVIERNQLKTFYITEKLDGSSMSVYKKNGELGVCSRNLELLETPGNTLFEMAKKYNLAENLMDGFCVQGEVVGEGIQKNPLKLTGHDFYVYNVYDFLGKKYLDFDHFKSFCSNHGLKTVPIINHGFTLNNTVQHLIEIADGKSLLNPNEIREGLVFRPLVEELEEIGGTMQRFSFKVISNAYLLGED